MATGILILAAFLIGYLVGYCCGKDGMTMDEKKSAMKIIEEVCEDICNRYCKYGDTVDEDGECEVGRGGEECPLMRLY